MFKNITTILAALAMTMALADNALAAFADLELIRVVYERTTGTMETATDLGNVNTLIATGGTIAGSLPTVTNADNLFVTYFAIERGTTANQFGHLWVSGSTDTTKAPVAVGTPGFTAAKNGTNGMFGYYNTLSTSTVTVEQSYINSFKTKLDAAQGAIGNAINIATRVNTEATLAALVDGTATAVTQNLYYFVDNRIAGSKGVVAATITTNADGSTTISNQLTDTTPPIVTIDTPPPTTSTSATVSVGFTAADVVGVTGYMLNETKELPLAGVAGWVAITPTTSTSLTINYTYSDVVPGTTKTLYVWAKDAAGNVSAIKASTTDITNPDTDTIAPIVDTFTIPTTSTSLTVSITSFTSSDNVGVTGYLLTESSTAPSASATDWTSTAPTSYSFITAGDKTLYAWVKDTAGNVSISFLPAPVTITLTDIVAPTVTAFTIPATFTSLTVNVMSLTASDNVGVTGYLLTESSTPPSASAAGWTGTAPTSYTFATAGDKTLYAWAKDTAGHVSISFPPAPVTITLPDMIAPTISTFTIPATSTSLTVSISSFTAGDNLAVTGYILTESSTAPSASATGWIATAPTSYSFTTVGNKTLYAWAKDAVGNVSAGTPAPVTITLPDTTVPSITAFTVPSSSGSLTVTGISITASDDTAVTGYLLTESDTAPSASSTGWSATAPTSYTFTTASSKTLWAWARDASGNISAGSSAPVTITLYPSGDVDGSSSTHEPDIRDALQVLKYVVGLDSLTSTQWTSANVAPLVNGHPQPNDKVDIGDALVILKRVVKLVSW